MLFMISERFRDDDAIPTYRRLREAGRALPEGLEFLGSWVAADFSRCFQLMRCEDLALLQAWVLQWRGTGVSFEITPVLTGEQTCGVVAPHLDDAS